MRRGRADRKWRGPVGRVLGRIAFCLGRPEGADPAAGGPVRDLTGDRDLEWSFVSARIGRYADASSRVLDFGCGTGPLTLAAASLGARVLALDLLEQPLPAACPNVEFRRGDLMDLEDGEGFDLVINCSTIEHVGLAGRYGVAVEDVDGDLRAMRKLRSLMKPRGRMLMTLPVGRDAVIRPRHRIYGAARLPRVLRGFDVEEAAFFLKDGRNVWVPCSRDEALREPGGERYYALGLMVLAPAEETC